MLQRIFNIITSKGVLVLLFIYAAFATYEWLAKPSEIKPSSEVNIQNILDKNRGLKAENVYLNREIKLKETAVDSLEKGIKVRDEKILKYDKELAKFKTLKNEKRTVIDNYTPDQIDSAMSREGFHTYRVKTLR